MRATLPVCLALTLGLGPSPPALAADPGIAVIVARDAPQARMDRVTLRDIYLKKVFVDEEGNPLVPVNLPAGDPLRRAFSLSLLGKPSDALEGYWNARYFHGVRPPYVLGSPNAVVRFVASTEGAIGYVAACQLDDSVRELMRLPLPTSERKAVDRLCDEPGPPNK